MPIGLWWYALSPLDVWICAFKQIHRNRKLCLLWIEVICYVLGSVAMVSEKNIPELCKKLSKACSIQLFCYSPSCSNIRP